MPLQGRALRVAPRRALTRLHAAGSAAPALQRDDEFKLPQLVLAKAALRGVDGRGQLGQPARWLGGELRRWRAVVGQYVNRGSIGGVDVPGGQETWVHAPFRQISTRPLRLPVYFIPQRSNQGTRRRVSIQCRMLGHPFSDVPEELDGIVAP